MVIDAQCTDTSANSNIVNYDLTKLGEMEDMMQLKSSGMRLAEIFLLTFLLKHCASAYSSCF